jgi:SAM-dependent methyltransferase
MMDPIPTQYVRCDLCGSEDHELLYRRLDPVTQQEFNLVRCRCGMAFVNPMPTEESIALLYPSDYLKDKQGNLAMYDRMMKVLPLASRGRLLDIGCGRGDFINHASRHGWRAEGVDLLSWDSPHNVPIRVGDFLNMDLGEAQYDAITAWAILEHVRKPSLFFGKVSELLAGDGVFVFVVPNFDALGMSISCTEDIPRHLHLFTPRGVAAHLRKHGMKASSILHNDRIYTSYPFGLLRHAILRLRGRETRCARYENRSVAALRNRQIKGNLQPWLTDVVKTVRPADVLIDALDLALGILVANISKALHNYGVITVIARKS